MHPARSVIFFTTVSGAGYGLFVVLALFALAGGGLPSDRVVIATLWAIGLVLIVAGLLSSTLHLGHPERAWRAVTQWRSSWLSREGVASLLTFLPLGAWGLLLLVVPGAAGTPGALALAALSGLCCLATLYCTAMIYASLRPIPAWSNGWTPLAYLVLGPMTGALILSLAAHAFGFATPWIDGLACLLLIAGMLVKLGYWRRVDHGAPRSTAESATGLAAPGSGGRVHLFEAPHTEPNYLMQEMGFRIARKHRTRLRRIAIVAGFLLPLGALAAAAIAGQGPVTVAWLAPALAAAAIGLMAERYLFFAEAKHAQSLYYGEGAV